VSGDLVLADADRVTRVLVTQHRSASPVASVLLLEHAAGSLSLTPDHVLEIDGDWAPARLASRGSRLSGGAEVLRVSAAAAGVINPITAAGTILAAGKEGGAVLASSYPEWIADFMLSSSAPLPLCRMLSYLFPAAAQAFHDAHIEPLFPAAGGYRSYLEAVLDAVPPALSSLALVAGDLAVASAFALFGLSSAPLLLAAGLTAAKARK